MPKLSLTCPFIMFIVLFLLLISTNGFPVSDSSDDAYPSSAFEHWIYGKSNLKGKSDLCQFRVAIHFDTVANANECFIMLFIQIDRNQLE